MSQILIKMSQNISVRDFEIFKDALTEENLELQVVIIQKLESLSKALGEKATREELLPFIQKHYIELHDEILFHLAEQLKFFVRLVGGLEHSKIVFDMLAKLCITDESMVREKAVETITAIQSELNTQQTEEYVLPIVNGLMKDDWFTSKCSAMQIIPSLYLTATEGRRAELRNYFRTLIQDDAPMVRKAAALACIHFVSVLEDGFLKNEFVPIFRDIAQDPMDSVRSVTIDIALALLKRLNEEDVADSIFKTVEEASDDVSWRLRQCLANNITALQHQIPSGKYRGKLLALYQKLTQDVEPEVRILAASNLFSYCKNLENSYLSQPETENNFEPVFEQSIMSIIQRLAVDENEDVRLALSSNILPLSTVLSEDCFKKNIISFLLQVLDTEESIAIQTNFLLGLSNLSTNVDLSQSLSAIKNAVRAVIVRSQANWRTRRTVLRTFIDIAKFCDSAYFSDHFKIYYAALLGDTVFAVRRSAAMILPVLSKHYGIKWASEHLVPFFTMFTRDSRYLYRFVPLFGISEMIHPHLCLQPASYLSDFKKLVEDKENPDNKKAILALVKIVKTSHLVQKELREDKYSSILKLKDELDYLSTCDTQIYSEKEFDELKGKYSNVNVYSVDLKDLDKDRWPYLQGILGLIYNKFLPIIDLLNKDVTENIQIRAICTLEEISNLITKLNQEETQDWVQRCVQSLTPEELSAINDEIHYEFKTADFKDEDLIDTNLMDFTEEPELNETICIENSNLIENKDISANEDTGGNQEVPVLDKNISESCEEKNVVESETQNNRETDSPSQIAMEKLTETEKED